MLPPVKLFHVVPGAHCWRAVVHLFILLALFGCARRETKKSAEAVHPPAQPSGPQIGKTDALLNAAVPKLSTWMAMWAAALPGFEADSLWAGSRGRWLPGSGGVDEDYLHEAHESPDDVTFKLLAFPSPGGHHLLYVDVYQAIMADGDTLEIGGEPDSRTVLINQRTNTVAIIRSCGTPCGSHWAAWLSPTSFALAGWQDADAYSEWKQGTLEIYSIPDSTVATYVTRVVPAKDYEQYVSAWESWLLKRYRALRNTHS